jgi:L-threonine-O-3-phosphate decarboxylase
MDPEAIDSLSRVTHGGEADPQLLDFSANTNPHTPSGVAAVYEAALSAARRYPVDDYCEFRAAAAEYVGVTGSEIIPAAGSLAGMRLLFSVIVDAGDSVVVPTPSFSEYAREIRLQGGTPTFVAHDEVLAVEPAAHDLVIICNPNNPTGESYETAALRAFAERCAAADTVLCVDEAFIDFTDTPSLAGTPGVVVARSLTKIFGLPGLRAGFLVATGGLQERLDVARPAWTLSTPAAAVGAHCLGATEFVETTRRRVAEERERMRERLTARFDVAPSDAPFLLCETHQPAGEVVAAARERGVVVRDATTFRGLESHIRVAVKRPEQNDRLLAALDV